MDGAVTAVLLLPGGRVLAASDGGVVRAFGGDEPAAAALHASQPVRSLAGCGRYLALGLEDGNVEIHAAGAAGGPSCKILGFAAHSAAVLCLQFLTAEGGADGDAQSLFSGGADGAVRAWSLTTGEATVRGGCNPIAQPLRDDACGARARSQMHIAGAHNAAVTCLQADHSKIVSGGRDGSVRVWDAITGLRRFTLAPFTAYLDGLAFAGPLLVTTGVNDAISVSTFSPPA